MKLSNTQDRYSPDAGIVVGPVFCGVCENQMNEIRNIDGPRSSVEGMAGISTIHDYFLCPDHDETWHKQAITLRLEAKKTASATIEKILLDESNTVLEKKECSK